MKPVKLPYILSPSLGCPQIIPLDEKGKYISVIVAATHEPDGKWSLVKSSSNQRGDTNPIQLHQKGIAEIPQGFNRMPSSLEETREVLSRELFIKVLDGKAKIFKVSLSLSETDPLKLLRSVKDSLKPTLYDLCLAGPSVQKKLHAVCLAKPIDKELHFIHLADLHLARRNDLIEDEISAITKQPDTFIRKFMKRINQIVRRNANVAPSRFNNFNENLRTFIKSANQMADKGELDFVLVGGDLVDFVNHGVSDEVNEADNNWQVFIEIMTGGGHESKRKNPNDGIKVPVFTSTGNHDWRLHPYNIAVAGQPDTFGLQKDRAEKFDFEYYDTVEALKAKRTAVYEKITKEGSLISKEYWLHRVVKWVIYWSEKWQAKILIPTVAAVASNLFPSLKASLIWPVILFLAASVLHNIINSILGKYLRYLVTNAVIPIEAHVHALHYYFLHINPYFNYAFSFGSNYFLVMDTGPDCFVGQHLWSNGNKKMTRISITDNILGGSPDSMAFYPANEYYSYGQLVWLEKMLETVGLEKETRNEKKRIFLCLHSPPINVENPRDLAVNNGQVLLEKGRVEVRYGTINHFLSEFFHLCLGKKEEDPEYSGMKVDIVLSGHTHHNIDFRIASGPKIYCGKYSERAPHPDFDEEKPFVVQTAACGPIDKLFPNPPYFRMIHVDEKGSVLKF